MTDLTTDTSPLFVSASYLDGENENAGTVFFFVDTVTSLGNTTYRGVGSHPRLMFELYPLNHYGSSWRYRPDLVIDVDRWVREGDPLDVRSCAVTEGNRDD